MQISLSFASAEICTQTNDRENNKRLVQVSPTYSWADLRLREHDYPPAHLRPEFRNAAARVLAKHRGLKTRIKMMNNTQTSRIVTRLRTGERGAKLIEQEMRRRTRSLRNKSPDN